ncbi:VCBS repeat-containing protein [Pelagicoccus albus]|uniref:VCBS repeat-containing protein n=2 Tax=Pelagicoccus albus TaxID=415222 RepID=A0A7X1B3M0_9BACT|nr:VCBS repeat-containing protein [Pelagicoccus albus]
MKGLDREGANASLNVQNYLKKKAYLAVVFLGGIGCFNASGTIESTALIERVENGGETLFTELSELRTGILITNNYDDPRMWGDLHSEYNVGAIGTGVAIGDYDADGRPDIFVVSKIEPSRLFRNLGDWKFEDVTEAAGLLDESGEWKQGSSFVDVDNDGWLDLYLCRFGVPNQLFMNQGDGTFREEAAARGLALIDSSGMGCFADYDRDGWLDVFVQTNLLDAMQSVEGQRDRLYRNRGDGTFEEVSDEAGILAQPTQGHSATWWDQNNDGWLDLYVANDFAVPDFLYRNSGDGTFTNVIDQALPHMPFSAMGADLGDVDNDGLIDFFVADMAGLKHEFSQRGITDTRAMLRSDQNELRDVSVQIHYNAFSLNTGTDRSLEAAHLAGLEGTDWTWSPRFEDLNSDGRLDLFITNGMDREHNNLDFITKKLRATNISGRIRITKMMSVLEQENLAFANRGNLQFDEVGGEWGLDKMGVSFGSALGDLDGDGDLDIVFGNFKEGPTVLRNDGVQGHNLIVELRGVISNRFGIGAKVEIVTSTGKQTRQLISARGYLSTSEPVVHFGVPSGEEIEKMTVVWPSGNVQEFSGIEVDKKYLVTEFSHLEEEFRQDNTTTDVPLFRDASVALGLAVRQKEEKLEGTVSQPLLHKRFNRRGPSLAIGDLDGDAIDEVLFGATAVDGVKLFQKEGDTFRLVNTGGLSASPLINQGPSLIFDANGDGLNDVFLTGGGAALPAEEPEYEPELWLNQGGLKFSKAPEGYLPSLPISAGAAVAADFDRDGRLDVFIGGRLYPGYYPEAAGSALLLQRESGFQDRSFSMGSVLAEVGLVTSALASDVDQDGWIDLLVSLEWGGVKAFRNEEGQTFRDASRDWGFSEAGSGLWTSIAGGDFNEDGIMDYAVGNQGLNTLYSGTKEHPMKLFVYDFAGSGEPQLVLSYNVDGFLSPVASRGELASKIPEVRRKFPSNDRFAAASMEEIFGEAALAKADVYEAGEMRSGVFLSQAKGTYLFSPLPMLAQISPVQGIVASDFNGDGHCDIALVHNDYSSLPAQGRFDSGLGSVLLGDGAGGFEEMSTVRSGWQIPGNAKALSIGDFNLDALPDLLATRNDQESMAVLNTGNDGTGRICYALKLNGPQGNPDGIGARLLLESLSHGSQSQEMHAGGGYASQSSSTFFFTIKREQFVDTKVSVIWPDASVTDVALPDKEGYFEVGY